MNKHVWSMIAKASVDNNFLAIERNGTNTILRNHTLFSWNNFPYNVGYFISNSMWTLLYFRYRWTKLQEGIIKHFWNCLHEGNTEVVLSYECELSINTLIHMHGVHSPYVYLERMAKSTLHTIFRGELGLWGYIFCIHWLSNWLKIPIRL